MKNKKKAQAFLILSAVIFISVMSTCISDLEYLCRISGYYGTFSFLLAFSVSMIPISILLFFSSEVAFHIWKKFSIIYLIASIVLVANTSNNTGLLPIDKKFMAMLTAGIFFVVSLGIIFGKREKNISV
ncbi:MAG: hypothetical protein OEV93_04195 [Candidatus Moranbacteria bacterium]|nr:hypothetical protein [Candidatus Moranbacteria bacterium]